MIQRHKPTPDNCAELIKDHQYTLLAKTDDLEAWRAQKPGSSAYAFDLVMSRYGIAMYGDTGNLVWKVGASYGLKFLANEGDDDDYVFTKLDANCQEKDLDEDYLDWIVFDAIEELLGLRNIKNLPEWLPDTAPKADRFKQQRDWLLENAAVDPEYGALAVALNEVPDLEDKSISGAFKWLEDHQELLELSDDLDYDLGKPTNSVMRRIYFARHAARQILAQKELAEAAKSGLALMTEAENSHLNEIGEEMRQFVTRGLYAVKDLETGEYLAFATEDQADMHAGVVNLSAMRKAVEVVPTPWNPVEHWKAVAQRLQADLTTRGKESVQRMMEHAETVAVHQVELMNARGFIVAAHAWENNAAAIETVAGIDKVLASQRQLALMERAKPVEYAYAKTQQSEQWSSDSLASYVSDYELAEGAVIYRGTAKKDLPSSFLPDVDDVINHMANRASDESEYADGFPDLNKEQETELESLMAPLRAWVDRHCDVRFYEVVDIQPYTVTAEDVAAAAAYREQRDHFETPAAVAKQIYGQQELKALVESGQVEPTHGLSVRPSESSKPGEQA
ncbi:hypothetical protein [Pseudomonas putida]|uniref:Uncharacterized protein n=1 Tax=Pseudomonas putida TaxID=303 RepID=A0A1L7NPW6_PSEPU|nr:hypothetical protein [Pseudomonas putida]BAW27520.1 Uncharacterized protein KF715C_pC870 [Pseudomonas putida]